MAALRIAAARNPHGEQLVNLIGELSMRSDPFRAWWAAQDVYVHQHGTKRFHHPAIGDLDLDFEAFELPGDQTLWPNPNDEQLAGRTLRGNPPTRRRTGSRGGQRSR